MPKLTLDLSLVSSGDYTINQDALNGAPYWVKEVVLKGVLSDTKAMTEGKTIVVQSVTDSANTDTALVKLTLDGAAAEWKLRRNASFAGGYSYWIEDGDGKNQCIHGAVS